MNIFVTGGAGYIGSACTEYLLNAGHEVTVFDNLSEGHRAAVDSRARFIQGDLARADEVEKALQEVRYDAVVHLAASALVGESMRDPGKYFGNNVSAGVNLLEAMRNAGVGRIVFSSSCATYGLPEALPITETARQYPMNPYGESKLMFERMLPWYEQACGLIYVGLRFFNVAGALDQRGEDHRIETHLIPTVLGVALGRREHFEICGGDYATPDGTCVRDFVHVADIAQAHLDALTSGRSGFFNLGTGRGYSVGKVVACAREITGHAIPVNVGQRRPGDPAELVADPSKARAALGWQPRFSDLRSMIESAWRWHRSRPAGYGGS